MKLAGDIKFNDDGSILHVEKFSDSAAFSETDHARAAREHKGGKLLDFVSNESEPQYCYPPWLEQLWSNKWKVRQDDPAFENVIQLEFQSGEWERFRV